jgi:predicted  nucleic acid-binding Zn-ribbon protein
MQEDLQYLLELSAVDKKVYELKLTKKDLPVRIQTLKDDIEREKTNAEKTNAAIAETKAKIAENQDMAVVEQTALTESNHRLEAISTNREYDAVHLEIATHKRNIDNAQANVIHFQQILENLLKEKEAADVAYKTVLDANGPELNRLTEELNGIEDKMASETAKAEAPRNKINKKVLAVYDRVVKRRGNPNVIAAINRTQKACLVCNRTQTPQRVIEISKKNALLTCESCGSILVWKEDMV